MRKLATRLYVSAYTLKHTIARAAYQRLKRPSADGIFRWNGFAIQEPPGNDDYISSAIGQFKKFETMATLAARSAASPVIFDVGAHIGVFSLCCSRIPGAKIFGFEPVSSTFNMNVGNMVRNSAKNVATQPLGLFDKDTDIAIGPVDDDVASTSFSIFGSGRDAGNQREVSHFTMLDRFVRDRAIKALDFMKIDVEGSEPAAIQGGLDTIRRFRPAILFEYVSDYYDRFKISRAIWQELTTGLDYELLRPTRRGWVPFPAAALTQGAHNADYLLLPKAGRLGLRDARDLVAGF
jgi:FkbM family methyltransferase